MIVAHVEYNEEGRIKRTWFEEQEPFETRYGAKVELVHINMGAKAKPFLRSIGYRKLFAEYRYPCNAYAKYPWPWIYIKVCYELAPIYWSIIRFLYLHTPLFSTIPDNVVFSWRYFKPLNWLKNKKVL